MKQKLSTWKRLVAEFLLILIGVSIAFIAEDLRETRGRQNLLLNYMSNLGIENERNIIALHSMDSLIGDILTNTNHFYRIQQNKDSLAQSEELLRVIMLSSIPPNFYTGQWEALKISGLSNDITNKDLQYQLALVYDNVYPELTRSLNNITQAKMSQMMPFYIRERAGREIRLVNREKIMSDEVYMLIRTYGTLSWSLGNKLENARVEIGKLDSLLNLSY
ncbi:MAG: hypothetical protein HQ556_02745 [Candidatus Marinimicrobia bacterium]|nr:hypothetical protein [Candidatus Neomarinimicrobiota bacterium]